MADEERPAQPEEALEPMVRMRHEHGYGCGWNGVAYEPDENGIITVPLGAQADVRDFGFRVVLGEVPPAEPAATAAPVVGAFAFRTVEEHEDLGFVGDNLDADEFRATRDRLPAATSATDEPAKIAAGRKK